MAEQKKPNVLLILTDDVGWFDVGAYHRGIMGAQTPNIDRIAQEGALLTDCYAQANCTAGRAAFITGQLPMRTGLTTVGLPGAPQGLQPEDPTLAELLKPEGYMTAQIGKNHLGDRNEFLPRFTASTSSSATFITSMPRKSPSRSTIRRTIRRSRVSSSRAASSIARQRMWTTPPRTAALDAWANRRYALPVR
jgi:arylsulfatase A-like enzyme